MDHVFEKAMMRPNSYKKKTKKKKKTHIIKVKFQTSISNYRHHGGNYVKTMKTIEMFRYHFSHRDTWTLRIGYRSDTSEFKEITTYISVLTSVCYKPCTKVMITVIVVWPGSG